MGGFSIWHWIIVLLIVLLLFGAGKLPQVMGDLAKGIKNFKAGLKDEDDADKPAPAPAPVQANPVQANPVETAPVTAPRVETPADSPRDQPPGPPVKPPAA
ncbi:MAG TPA: twin-arginine translocase TatA/TatE family subunit [Azospirillum sp.]